MSIGISPISPHDRKTGNAKWRGIASTVVKSLVMTFGIAAASMLISRGMGVAAAATSAPGAATETPAVVPGTPIISSIPKVVLVGGSFNVTGTGFTPGSVLNFFVATPSGPINEGPLKPNLPTSPTLLTVKVPATVTLGEGFVSVVVINTDEGFKSSNPAFALLQGAAAAGIPSLTSINGKPLATTSGDPSFATNNVETVVAQGATVTLGGNGFDTAHGVAVDVFCACKGGKVTTSFLLPGNPNLTSSQIKFTLPLDAVTGPGSVVVSNAGPTGSYSMKSNAVSVPIGAQITINSVVQKGTTIQVNGAGFSKLTVINFFNAQAGGAVNLGGLNHAGMPRIALTIVNGNLFTLSIPAGAVAGPAYIQALNPPFVPFSSSGSGAGGAFVLKLPVGPTPTPTAKPSPHPTPTRTPTPAPTATLRATPTPTPVAGLAVEVFVTNRLSNSLTIYSAGSDGDAAPVSTIAGASTGLSSPIGIALDSSGKIYVANAQSGSETAGKITVYPAGSKGNVTPSISIFGSNTGLGGPVGIAVDSHGKIYVANSLASGGIFGGSVTVYSAGSNGDVSAIATISGDNTALDHPSGIALDSRGNIYVSNNNGDLDNIVVFPAGSNGDVTPSEIISGHNTGLNSVAGLALDSANRIYVADEAFHDIVVTHVDGRNADPPPLATIPVTIPVDVGTRPLGVALDSTGNIYVASSFGGGFDSITMYPAGSNSSSKASVTIIGANTLLDLPTGIAIRPMVPSATPTPGGATPTPTPTPRTAGIVVSNQRSVVIDAPGSNGNVTPSAYIAGIATQLGGPLGSMVGIAFDSSSNIYIADGNIKVYPAGSDGNVAPTTIIKGTGEARGVALDSMGNIYVSNSSTHAGPTSITVYPAGSSGTVAPIATISGSNTGLTFPEGIALDSSANIYVVNFPDTSAYSVTVYSAGSDGNVAPSATIAGAATGLSGPIGIALDSRANIYVANATGGLGKSGSVTIYPAGSNGDVTPSATIVGSTNTELNEPDGIAVDSHGNIYVSNRGSSSITVYSAGSNGDVAPIVNIGGPDTKIGGPVGIAILPSSP